jgi:hypothetical protein
MKKTLYLIGFFLFFQVLPGYSNYFFDYFKSKYAVTFVDTLPKETNNKILMISTRFFKPGRQYSIHRGLHPKYQIFYFIAGVKNDTAFVQPLSDLSEVTRFLPSDKDFLLYVDGHGKSFGQSMDRGFELTSRFNINMVVFDWPSDYLALRKTVYSADDVSVSFIKVSRSLKMLHEKFYESSAFSVIFHSMGNRILKIIGSTRMIDYMPKQLFENVIINAAAVKQYNHSKWVEPCTERWTWIIA